MRARDNVSAICEELGQPRIAPVGLLIDLIRMLPGEEEACLSAKLPASSSIFFVLGEWDLLRFNLTDSVFPRARDVDAWPPLTAKIQNHHSFLAHIWMPEEELINSLIDVSGEVPRLSEKFKSIDYPLTLLICLKLDPRPVQKHGILAEWAVVKHALAWAAGKDLLLLPAGSVGWQELVFVVRAKSLSTARELVRELFDLPAAEIFRESPEVVGYPLVTRSITYPCISHESYLEKVSVPLIDLAYRAQILVNLRPGLRHPLQIEKSDEGPLALLEGVISKGMLVTERFGEYDLALHFPAGSTLPHIISVIRGLRATNIDSEYQGWLHGTATLIEFEPPLEVESRVKGRSVFVPLGSAIDAEAIRAAVREFRWFGVENLHSERLITILGRVASYCTDPFLAESVEPLKRYFAALGAQISEAHRELRESAEGSGSTEQSSPLGIEIEPEDIEQICGVLEFTLRQRLEGLQQLLFNALPNSFYGRGGMNRLLAGADKVLQEVSGIFAIESPGFVVFGMPDYDGFASFGPIVVAPIPALFSLEWWWVIYHEAAVYIETHLFSPDALGPTFSFGYLLAESSKLVPDLITLALPFRYDLDLFSLMHAKRLASVKARRAESTRASVALRLATLFLLRKVAGELKEQGILLVKSDEGLLMNVADLGSRWSMALETKEIELIAESPLRNEILGFIATFLRRVDSFSLSYRRSQDIDLDEFVKNAQIFPDLAKQCQSIRSFWCAACEAYEGGDSRALVAIEYLTHGLLAWSQRSSPADLQSSLPGVVPLAIDSIADMVYLSLGRWERRVNSGDDERDVPADVQDRLGESLAVWHKGVLRESF